MLFSDGECPCGGVNQLSLNMSDLLECPTKCLSRFLSPIPDNIEYRMLGVATQRYSGIQSKSSRIGR